MSKGTTWIAVGDLAQGFKPDSFRPTPSAELAGRHFTLCLERDVTVELMFTSPYALTVRAAPAASERFGAQRNYRASRLRGGIFLVDFLPRDATDRSSVSIVLDTERNAVTVVEGSLPTRAEAASSLLERIANGHDLTAVTATFTCGVIGSSFQAGRELHRSSNDLVGRRVEYTYSPHEQYEHVYLTPDRYAWHCLKGREAGLADVDRCHYVGIADGVYLFVWREKIIPTLGVAMIDFVAQRTTGKIFGYQSHHCTDVINFPMGAKIRER